MDKNKELENKREESKLGGGLSRIEKQHSQGKLSARERIYLLLDEGTFQEIGALVSHRSTDFGLDKKKIPGDGALWYAQSLEFLLPIRIGDKLKIIATVLKKIDRQNSIELQTDIYNQHKQKVTSGIAKVKIIEDEVARNDQEVTDEKTILII